MLQGCVQVRHRLAQLPRNLGQTACCCQPVVARLLVGQNQPAHSQQRYSTHLASLAQALASCSTSVEDRRPMSQLGATALYFVQSTSLPW